MLFVTTADWNALEERLGAANLRAGMRHEHDGKVCEAGERMIRLGHLTRQDGDYSALVFEHIHFEIVDRVSRVPVGKRVSA